MSEKPEGDGQVSKVEKRVEGWKETILPIFHPSNPILPICQVASEYEL